ncbi:Lipopolysaccharide-modifying protein [Ophiocordyceps camponoti-floridani]|uniref:Lipopolysaccharide-modifying protein n=1 Tax=Ophiocordyceps camponoti-floridani TaxID=2030778 RepID=A0A8H4QDE0_9HYPO|nr:Lipopolysaccharide-modifying protein [Ophiocordyceps camponoti-floridani]
MRSERRLWPLRLAIRYLTVALLVSLALLNFLLWHQTQPPFGHRHPIQRLMAEAETRARLLMARRSLDLPTAAARYRHRRRRHPPPGFDDWFRAAVEADAVVVEDFFDRIYKDVTPFWALSPSSIRRRATAWHWVVRVRNGTASAQGNVKGRVPWLQLWTALVSEFSSKLPDVDMPVNMLDEARILVPHADMARLVAKAESETTMADPDLASSRFSGLADVDHHPPPLYEPPWFGPGNSYWNLAAKTCGPDTPAHGVRQIRDFAPPAELPPDWRPSYSLEGFVQNWTAAMDPCLQPHLRQLHGTFIEPLSLSSTDELIPIFGGSKLPMNSEMLIPGAMYLTDDTFYSGGEAHGPAWPDKKDGLIWRGDASGGRAKEHSWHHFQRHRLVDMLNGTTVSRLEASGVRAPTFSLPSTGLYRRRRQLGAWIARFADAAFVHLCPPGECDFVSPYFRPSDQVPMEAQYQHKFLPDADGNSFSARFRGFLRSTSLPIKATIYAEWHDDRLIPWLHFVPMDNTFQDLYALLDFFAPRGLLNNRGDAAARLIAERGRDWAETVLRREDMRLYVWRLLLEWARVCDDERHNLGFVDDLRS